MTSNLIVIVALVIFAVILIPVIISRNISGAGDGRGAAGNATDQITGVIQTLLATQLVSGQLRLDAPESITLPAKTNGTEPVPAVTDAAFSAKRR